MYYLIIIVASILLIYVAFDKKNKQTKNNQKLSIKLFEQTSLKRSAFKYMFKYKGRMIGGAVIKVIGTVMDLVLPYILSYILDYVVPSKNVTTVILFGLLMLICALIGLFGSVFANQLASKVARLVTKDLRHDLFMKIQSLSSAQLDEITIPSLVSRMTSDTYNIHQMTGMLQRIGIRAPILFIGGIIITFTLDPIMTLVLLALLPLIILITYLVSKTGIPLFTNVQEAVDGMVQTIRENTSGVRVIKALSKGEYEKTRFDKINNKVKKYELKSGYTMSILSPIISTLLNFGLIGVIVVGAYRVNNGAIKAGTVLAFTTYFSIILNAMLTITRIFIVYSRAAASGKRIDEVLNLPTDLNIFNSLVKETNNHIEFNEVSFSYNKKVNNIENLNFMLKQGETLGIIGSTGSGKSTVIQLLMRFYDVDEGEILINGKNVKAYNPEELKKKFGVVFQNDTIFSDTVYNNIVFGRDVSYEDVVLACKVAQAYDFIMQLEDGFNTNLNAKGTNLSGGQRLRLLIARALVAHPEILILDDSSSALDYKTDALLRKEIKTNFKDTTMIIIAQRISSIMACDHILIMEDGQCLGYGNHESLMKEVPIYQETYHIQMGGGINE